MIRFIPRNVGCWRNDSIVDGEYRMEMLLHRIDFPSESSMEEFFIRHFDYIEEHRPTMELSDGLVKYGLVIGYYEYTK